MRLTPSRTYQNAQHRKYFPRIPLNILHTRYFIPHPYIFYLVAFKKCEEVFKFAMISFILQK